MANHTLIPPSVSSPGVYVQELSSQAHDVPSVPTSLTAFVGRARMGPVHTPVLVQDPGQFAALFGGLWEDSELSFAVQDFFNNGGDQAVIVRLFASHADAQHLHLTAPVGAEALPETASECGSASIGIGAAPSLGTQRLDPLPPYARAAVLTLQAASPGRWGNQLTVSLDQANITEAWVNSLGLGLPPQDFFNLHITFTAGNANEVTTTETHARVTLQEGGGPRRLDRVLGASSRLASWDFLSGIPTDFLQSWQANFLAQQADPTQVLQSALPSGSGGNDGYYLLSPECFTSPTLQAERQGLYALDKIELFNLLVIPRDQRTQDNCITYSDVFTYIVARRAFWILEPPIGADSFTPAILDDAPPLDDLINIAFQNPGTNRRNAAVYFPDIQVPDPLRNGLPVSRGPGGLIAGIYARTDASRGVWAAPAGQEATLRGSNGPARFDPASDAGVLTELTEAQNGAANLAGINCLRNFPVIGSVVWGARTLAGAQTLDDEFKYVPVRRLMLWLEQTLELALRWTVFEPNDEALWSSVRLQVTGILQGLFAQGAFMGASSSDAFFVQCDATTTTAFNQDNGILNVVLGIAPERPAEFIVIYLQLFTQEPSP